MNTTKDPPVNPNNPLHELKAATSENEWFFSRPTDAVASKASLDLSLFFNLYKSKIGILYPMLVSTGQPIIQSYLFDISQISLWFI